MHWSLQLFIHRSECGQLLFVRPTLLVKSPLASCMYTFLAEMYPVPPARETQGLTDKYISTWLKDQKREDIVLATKVHSSNCSSRAATAGCKAARATKLYLTEQHELPPLPLCPVSISNKAHGVWSLMHHTFTAAAGAATVLGRWLAMAPTTRTCATLSAPCVCSQTKLSSQ